MLDQERVYRLLFEKNWNALIRIVHDHREEIKSEPALLHAVGVFENEFLNMASGVPDDDVAIYDCLEDFWTLHRGKFYQLKEENYRSLLGELARRNVRSSNFGYQSELEYLTRKDIEDQVGTAASAPVPEPPRKFYALGEWHAIYNRMFDLISQRGDPQTYFSGPRFIAVIQSFEPYFQEYNQYMRLRKAEGKDEGRKSYFEDILQSLDPNIRDQVISKILSMVRPFRPFEVSEIDQLLGWEEPVREEEITGESRPVVFISYAWDDEPHKEWVLGLANGLKTMGVMILLDRFDLKPGRNMTHYMERSIEAATKVLIIFSPEYKRKADSRLGGAGYEYTLINTNLYHNQINNDKFIPVLRKGDQQTSIPSFMRQLIYFNMTSDADYSRQLEEIRQLVFAQVPPLV